MKKNQWGLAIGVVVMVLLGTGGLWVAGTGAIRTVERLKRRPLTETEMRARELNERSGFAKLPWETTLVVTEARLAAWREVAETVEAPLDAWAAEVVGPAEGNLKGWKRQALDTLDEPLEAAPPAPLAAEEVRRTFLDVLESQQMSPEEFSAITVAVLRASSVLHRKESERHMQAIEGYLAEAREDLEEPDLSEEERASRARSVEGLAAYLEKEGRRTRCCGGIGTPRPMPSIRC